MRGRKWGATARKKRSSRCVTLLAVVGTMDAMDTPNTQPNTQQELFKAAPKKDQQYAKATVKAMLKRMEPSLQIGLFWLGDAQRNMPNCNEFDGEEE